MKSLALLSLLLIILPAQAFAKSFVYCSEGSPSSFNPQLVTDGTSITASSANIYNRLVEFAPGSTKLIPGLADSWTISKDKKVYIFNLRKNVKFHTTKYFTPTRDLNADDVIFSVERQRNKNHPFHNVSGGKYEYFDGMEMGTTIADIKALDPMKIQIILSRPDATFLANMAMSFMSVLSAEYGAKLAAANKKEDMDKMPVGTGAYLFVSYQKDSVIRYEEHTGYWGKKGNVDKLIFAITPDANVRTQKLKTGECQLATDPSPADIPEMKKNTNLTVMDDSGLNIGFLAMNVTKKPFDNLLVRQAISHALDKKTYINAIYMGNATIAKNIIPPTIWSYNNTVKDYDYNVEEAKALLKKAGFPNGFETELWTLPVARPYNPNGKKMGELMQADLAKIGVKVKLISYDWPTYLEKSKTGQHQMIQMGWTGDNGDPDNFFGVLLGCASVKSGSNYPRWCDQKFNKLIDDAKTTTDVAARTKFYMQAQVIAHDQAPVVNIAHSRTFKAMAKNIKGYKLDPLGQDYLTNIVVE
ncbi:MAG: ABC transporter substrate-binding protein [Bacteriovorax sp.]|nr:ABC transporter substrate-binding protein [Bacteriovorax sp.]